MTLAHSPLALAACVSVLLAGCAAKSPNLDQQFGQSVAHVKAMQVINPGPTNPDPVKGLDGKAAKSGYDEYQKSYRVPEPQPNALTIGLGK